MSRPCRCGAIPSEFPPHDIKTNHPRPAAELERVDGDAPLEAREGENGRAGRVHIRFVSVRKRLLDPDNLAEKWMLDCLRYCGAVPGDEPDKITLETTQRKTAAGEEEHTLIEVTF